VLRTPSRPTALVKAVITYDQMRKDALEKGLVEVAVEASKKALDYMLICSLRSGFSSSITYLHL